MAFCGACGAELVAGETHCRACGAAVPGAVAAAVPEPSERRTGRIVLIVAGVIIGLALVAGAVFLVVLAPWNRGGNAPNGGAGSSGVASGTATSSAGTSTSGATQTPVSPPAPATKPAPKSSVTANDVTHQPTFITKTGVADGGASTMTFDYVQFLTGSAADKAAKAHGDTVENDYYVVNDNKKLRTFPVASGVTIVLHPANGPQYQRSFTLAEFKSLMSAGSHTYGGQGYDWSPMTIYYVTIKNGKVSSIVHQWVP